MNTKNLHFHSSHGSKIRPRIDNTTDNNKTKRISSHLTANSRYYISSFWVRILNLSIASNLVNAFNLGSSVTVRIHVPNKDYVSSMILKLPIVCKFCVMQAWKLVYENCLWLLAILRRCLIIIKSQNTQYTNYKHV